MWNGRLYRDGEDAANDAPRCPRRCRRASSIFVAFDIIALSSFAIAFHLPIFLILIDDEICRDIEDGCRLGDDSAYLFHSMLVLLILMMLVLINEPPDWKEERELWTLMRKRREGAVENVALWQAAVADIAPHETEWVWV
jgi:hypothetical protein